MLAYPFWNQSRRPPHSARTTWLRWRFEPRQQLRRSFHPRFLHCCCSQWAWSWTCASGAAFPGTSPWEADRETCPACRVILQVRSLTSRFGCCLFWTAAGCRGAWSLRRGRGCLRPGWRWSPRYSTEKSGWRWWKADRRHLSTLVWSR